MFLRRIAFLEASSGNFLLSFDFSFENPIVPRAFKFKVSRSIWGMCCSSGKAALCMCVLPDLLPRTFILPHSLQLFGGEKKKNLYIEIFYFFNKTCPEKLQLLCHWTSLYLRWYTPSSVLSQSTHTQILGWISKHPQFKPRANGWCVDTIFFFPEQIWGLSSQTYKRA